MDTNFVPNGGMAGSRYAQGVVRGQGPGRPQASTPRAAPSVPGLRIDSMTVQQLCGRVGYSSRQETYGVDDNVVCSNGSTSKRSCHVTLLAKIACFFLGDDFTQKWLAFLATPLIIVLQLGP